MGAGSVLNRSHQPVSISDFLLNDQKNWFLKYIIFFLTVFAGLFVLYPATGYGKPGICPGGGAGGPGLEDNLLALKIYRVDNGKMETRVFDRGFLAKTGSLHIPGYVDGMVAVGRPGLTIRVDGNLMSPVRPGADGEISLGYYGIINPAQLVRPDPAATHSPQATESAAAAETARSGPAALEVYSLFSQVPGDTISDKSDFLMEISSGPYPSSQLLISQSGGLDPEVYISEGVCDFRFTGLSRKALEQSLDDMEDRLQAVSDGIAAVESTFQTDLVKTVYIIAYDDIRNAVTCLNQKNIWFYIHTFRDEPIKELKVIAEHEALHILVDRLDLTSNSNIRKIFADLKGLKDVSIERFQIVSCGYTPSKVRFREGKDGYFFEFISERNFLDGMKGGHPEENLDEFCASFLHSLMYPDRLEVNLARILPVKEGNVVIPEDQVRENIINRYISLLKIVRRILVTDSVITGTDFQTVSDQFFLQHLNMLENMRQTVAVQASR